MTEQRDDLSAALARIEGLAENATEGPWEKTGSRILANGYVAQASGLNWRENAEFIAAARTDLPALAAAVRAVLAVHVRHRDTHGKQPLNGPWSCCAAVQLGARDPDDCSECYAPWPCATVRAMTKPTQVCRVCGDNEACREWDRGFPPDAAKRRLAKRCKARGHTCDPRYLAGGAPELMRALGLDEEEQR